MNMYEMLGQSMRQQQGLTGGPGQDMSMTAPYTFSMHPAAMSFPKMDQAAMARDLGSISTMQTAPMPLVLKTEDDDDGEDDAEGEGDGDGDETNTSGVAKVKRTRRRQQTSCSACHRRKQKCNRQIPCDRCIKRGTADMCKVMPLGGQTDDSSSATQLVSPSLTASAAGSAIKRKRSGNSGDDDLAARVAELEQLIRNQSNPPSTGSDTSRTQQRFSNAPPTLINAPRPDISPANSLGPTTSMRPPAAHLSKPPAGAPQSAVEEAAAAALGQLSKAISKETGSEARIYSGPGSIADLLSSSAFGQDGNVQEERYMRARPSELALYTGGQVSLASMAHAPIRMTKLADELQEQKAKLPPPAMSHFLFDAFYNLPMFQDRNRIFPRAAIQMCYDGLWEEADRDKCATAEQARKAKFPQLASPNSLAFLSLVYVMLSSALLMQPGTMQDPDSQHLASVLYEASRASFMASERREQPTYAIIVAILAQAGWLKIAGCPSLGFTYVTQAIRFAQSMGLHREPAPSWGLGGFECEIRRRMWHMLVQADRGHSISYGRPYIIMDRHCDVGLPANVHERDLRPEGPTNARPMHECTEATFQHCSIAMSKVMAEVIDRAFSCVTPTYSTILELDNLLTATEHEAVPLAFKNPSIIDMIEKPYLKDQYVAFQIQACWLRALLHRPYLLRPLPKPGQPDHYAGSRAAAVMLSQRMITLSKESLSNVPLHYQAYFGYAFNLFEPSTNLAMAIIQDPGSANAWAIDQYVVEAMGLLEAMSRVNKVASEGLSTLKYLRTRYLKEMSSAKGASPSSSASHNGPGSQQSPFSLTYSSGNPSPVSGNETFTSAVPNVQYASSSGTNSTYLPTPQQQLAPDSAPTPNTLFNAFFNQYSATPAATANYPDPMENLSFEKLFNFDPSIYNNDPNAAWLTQPMEGGLAEQWPMTMPRLEGETDFQDWKKMLGL